MGNGNCASYCCQNEADDLNQITMQPKNELFFQQRGSNAQREEYIKALSRTDSVDSLEAKLDGTHEDFDPLKNLTVARDSIDFRRATTTKNATIRDTYQRFHGFIDMQIERL